MNTAPRADILRGELCLFSFLVQINFDCYGISLNRSTAFERRLTEAFSFFA
jgi:hypothetical protein